MVHLFKNMKGEHNPTSIWEILHRFFDAFYIVIRFHFATSTFFSSVYPMLIVAEFYTPFFEVIQTFVDGNSANPGAEFCIAPKGIYFSESVDKSFLHQVF